MVQENLKQIFQEYGFPRKVQHDQGPEFRGEVSVYLKKKKIRQIISSAYHPQSQGKIERMHRKLKSLINYDYITKKPGVWASALKEYAGIMNTTPKPVLGDQTPFGVFFGRSYTKMTETMTSSERHARALQSTRAHNNQIIKRQEQKLKTPLYAKGDRVIVKVPAKVSRVTGNVVYATGRVLKTNRKLYKCKVAYITGKTNNHNGEAWFHVKDITATTEQSEKRSLAASKFNKLLEPKRHDDYRKDFESTFKLPIDFDPAGDGNCLFSALAHQLDVHQNMHLNHSNIRRQVVEYLFTRRHVGHHVNRDEWENYVEESRMDYLIRMSADGTFGDHLALQAFSEVFQVQILVLSTLNDGTHLVSPNGDGCYNDSLPCIAIGHFDENNGAHYVSHDMTERLDSPLLMQPSRFNRSVKLR